MRYFLAADLGGEKVTREVTKEEWVRAERSAGFRPTYGSDDEPATASWSSGSMSGYINYDIEL